MSPKAMKDTHVRQQPPGHPRALEAGPSTSEPRVDDVVLGDFSISVAWEKRSVRVTFSGNADLDARDPLTDFLRLLHAEVLQRGVPSVVCDFGKLYFMNSACFKCFVVWINDVVSAKVSSQYSVRFIRNPQLQWQARTLESLRCFGPGVVFIETSS